MTTKILIAFARKLVEMAEHLGIDTDELKAELLQEAKKESAEMKAEIESIFETRY